MKLNNCEGNFQISLLIFIKILIRIWFWRSTVNTLRLKVLIPEKTSNKQDLF